MKQSCKLVIWSGFIAIGMAVGVDPLGANAAPIPKTPEATAQAGTSAHWSDGEQAWPEARKLPSNFNQRLQRYRRAAGSGNYTALFYLGEADYFGIGVTSDKNKGRSELKNAAKAGSADAATLLGAIDFSDAGTDHRQDAGLRLLHQGAHGGNMLAQRDLGIIYAGDPTDAGQKTAEHWFHLAALQGDLVSQLTLGAIELKKVNDTKRFTDAMFWLAEATKQGSLVALSELIHEWGIAERARLGNLEPVTEAQAEDLVHSPQTETLLANYFFDKSATTAPIAVSLYRLAAKSGYGPAEFGLADAHIFGRGVATDYRLARTEFEVAAREGVPQAYVNLGTIYSRGLGVAPNKRKAAVDFRLAASHGSAHGAYYLAKIQQDSKIPNKNMDSALSLYRLAAERGLPSAQLALALEPHLPNAQEPTMRYKWLLRAARGGNVVAARDLAATYRSGYGVAANRAKAAYWYGRAAQQGDRQARVDVALLHVTAMKNPILAQSGFADLRRLALSGNAQAAYNLGVLYAQGRNVALNYGMAVYWWRQAVNMHYSDAELALGIAYSTGAGVAVDKSKARVLLLMADKAPTTPERKTLIRDELSHLKDIGY